MNGNFLFSLGLFFLAISGIFCKLSTQEMRLSVSIICIVSFLLGVITIIYSEKDRHSSIKENLVILFIAIMIPVIFYFSTEIIIM